VLFVDAPVSGSVAPATSGELLILASGPAERSPSRRGPSIHGSPHILDGTRGRWLESETRAQQLARRSRGDGGRDAQILRGLGLDLNSSSMFSLRLRSDHRMRGEGRSMLEGDFSTNFALKYAIKDALLALEAAKNVDGDLALTASLIPSWQRASETAPAISTSPLCITLPARDVKGLPRRRPLLK